MDIDEVLENFSREELLSALGFDTPSDYLEKVTRNDALEYFGEDALIENIDMDQFWSIDDAYDRYGHDLLDYFPDHIVTEGWNASDYIAHHNDPCGLLEVLLRDHIDPEVLTYAIGNSFSSKEIQELSHHFDAEGFRNRKSEILDALLKLQKESLKGNNG